MQQTTHMPASRQVVVRAPGEGEPVWFLDNLLTYKASVRDGAQFGLVEATLPPGSRTPFHKHAHEDEAFYVLEGELTLFVECEGRVREIRARKGSYVHVPASVAHGFRTETDLRMLVITGVEGFIEMAREFGVTAPRRELPPPVEPDFARLGVLAAKYRIDLLGPLPE